MTDRLHADGETQPLATVYSLQTEHMPPDERFDRITRVVRQLFNVPIVMINLVDTYQVVAKSCLGLDALVTPRDIAFCAYTILQDHTVVIPDTLLDQRTATNPLVIAEPLLRFYAGHPLQSPDGLRVGTLCLMDYRPRTLTDMEQRWLQDLAVWAEYELHSEEYQRAHTYREKVETALQQAMQDQNQWLAAIQSVQSGIVVLDPHQVEQPIVYSNAGFSQITGYTADELQNRGWETVHDSASYGLDIASLRSALAPGQAVTRHVRLCSKNTQPIQVSVVITPIFDLADQLVRVVLVYDSTAIDAVVDRSSTIAL